MPIGLNPNRTATKNVTHPELDPAREWCTILSFLDGATLKASQEAGRKTINQGNRTREEFDQEAQARYLINAQLKSWQMEVPAGEVFDPETMTQDAGVTHWQFTPANVAKMIALWDFRGWLVGEILSCGGVMPTEALTIKTDSGQTLDYFRPDESMDQGGKPELLDPK